MTAMKLGLPSDPAALGKAMFADVPARSDHSLPIPEMP